MATLTPQEQTLHQQFSTYGRNAREWMRKCALLLPEIERRQIWKKKKFGSIYEYAAKLAGMSKAVVDEALWVLRKIEDKPELQKVVEEKGIRRVRPVLSLASCETASFWAEKANQMSIHALETYVRNYREAFIHVNKTQPEKLTIPVTLPAPLAKRFEQAMKRGDFEGELTMFLDRLDEKDKESTPEEVRTASRYIPASIKRHVFQRTNGLCAFPSCRKKATSLHHTQRFALEKVHDPARIQPVCTAHERLAHLGLIENEEGPPEGWKLREKADRNNHKFYVDQFVRLYRPT